MRAMRGAERVVDVQIAQLRQAAREPRVVLLFAAQKAGVLEQNDIALAVMRRLDRLVRIRAFDELDATRRKELLEVHGDSVERVFRFGLALRPAEMGQQDHSRAAL